MRFSFNPNLLLIAKHPRAYFLAIGLYTFLAIGSVTPVNVPSEVWISISVIFALIITSTVKSGLFFEEFKFSLILLTPLTSALLISLFQTENFDYAFTKLDAAIFTTLVSASIAGVIVRVYGEEVFLSAFQVAALFILIATLFYKIQFGFFARDVRFFLNGPIVFGWLMGASLVISSSLFIRNGGLFNLICCFLFVAATIWTLSKGPIIAMLIAVIYLIGPKIFSYRVITFILLVSSTLYVSLLQIPEIYTSRLNAIFRIFSFKLKESDFGSVGTRAVMFEESLKLWSDNLFWGVGVGDWSKQIQSLSEYNYPHNIYVEILAEGGLFLFVIVLLTVTYLWSKCSSTGRAIATVFLVGSAFSGDFGYFRLPLVFLIAMRVKK